MDRKRFPSFVSILFLLFLVNIFTIPVTAKKAHAHARAHHAVARRNATLFTNGTMSLTEAKAIVSLAHSAMATANAKILKNPQPNVHQLLNSSGLERSRQRAPPLDYLGAGSLNSTSSELSRKYLKRKRATNATESSFSNSSSTFTYTLPPEVVEAARIVAEASQHSTADDDDYSMIAAGLRAKYRNKTNDTNVPHQRLVHASGLMSYAPSLTDFELSSNVTNITHIIESRASTAFWMETLAQRGTAPFAPAGYKVWRNVKDYGAKGDGVTDDTAAINLAMTDGGRCGAGCPSSTKYPATIYFPSGTYLISTPIIQYYNTEMLGNPLDRPKLLGAASFTGGSIIASDVYTGEQTEWYLNTNNFLRSVRNFVIDIRATAQDAEICGIHWQVAQGTSLENIDFYMTKPTDNAATTQQGIYMENGSGGFMGDLTFIGGKFGAYMGNQQFTSSGLVFSDCGTALQIHWDWGWTIQDIAVENCGTGVIIVGGAGGPFSTGQGVGSLILTDLTMTNTKLGISTSLFADNSTAFLLANAGFSNVQTLVTDSNLNQVLLPGGSGTINVDSWGFGKIADETGSAQFFNANNVVSMQREPSLTMSESNGPTQKYFYSRRRPSYSTLGNSQLFDVKAYGAAGDGKTRDDVTLNSILEVAANISAIVYFPSGIYILEDTLRIPVGSRIIGQAWPQLMARGDKFRDPANPRAAVKVGQPGQSGVVEIQNMMFTVQGPSPGAVIVEWNVHESTQGSAGLWDSHVRVGGAAGSNLQASDCPKLTGSVNANCIAAALMMHITELASVYMENVWIWSADHDMEDSNQVQIDVYTGRGLLIESQGPTWLWATSVEHAVMYNYQASGAQNLLMGLVQTESPYFQVHPAAPAPFSPGTFANDPTFSNCSPTSKTCAVSWALRVVDSSAVYILSTGLYSWFQNYDQTCVNDGSNTCQDALFQTEESTDIWVYNLITIGAVQMVSPLNGVPTLAAGNRNGFASSLLAWLGGANQTTGRRTFTGYEIYTSTWITNELPLVSSSCASALAATIKCNDYLQDFKDASFHGTPGNDTFTGSVCDVGCGESLASWVKNVDKYCPDDLWGEGIPAAILGNYMWYGYNETCQNDPSTGQYCNLLMDSFADADTIQDIPQSELCSDCLRNRLEMMQANQYSAYQTYDYYGQLLQYAVSQCSFSAPTTTQPPVISKTPDPIALCASGNTYTAAAGDTCDSIALQNDVASASLFIGNSNILDCTNVTAGTVVCLPFTCQTYELLPTDDCWSITIAQNLGLTSLQTYNSWIDAACSNIQKTGRVYGRVLCLSQPGDPYLPGVSTNTSTFPGQGSGTSSTKVPPSANQTVAPGTTLDCGEWYTVASQDSCAMIAIEFDISLDLMVAANPSIDASNCDGSLTVGLTYCVAPVPNWKTPPKYIHCAADNMLSESPMESSNMTVELCHDHCQYYEYFGVSKGSTCHCGNQASIETSYANDTACAVPCLGDSSEMCGGVSVMSVYGTSTNILKWGFTRYGCFPDNIGITPEVEPTSNFQMTPDYCAAYCQSIDTFAFFGVENGNDCFCSDKILPLRDNTPAPDSACNIPCSGNSSLTCGANGMMEVFGIFSIPIAPPSSTSAAPSSATSFSSSTTSYVSTTTSPTTTSASPSPSSAYTYYGCYTEGSTSKALSGAAFYDYTAMTVEMCASDCLAGGFTLFGVEYGGECYCGTGLSDGAVPTFESDCNVPCAGSSAEWCGGGGRLNLYGQSSEPPSIPIPGGLPPVTHIAYQGCYTEATDSRALTGRTASSGTAMTVESCGSFCLYSGFLLFGMEYSSECYCGSELQPGSVIMPEADCQMPCSGDAAELCGGPSRLSLYEWTT